MLAVVLDENSRISLNVVGLIAVVGALWRVIVVLIRMRDQHLSLMRKVEIMWGFQNRRGQAEAANSGVITAPPAARSWLPERVRVRFADLRDDLHAFYRTEGRLLNDDDLKLEIEGRFGDRIAHDVCRPLHWHEGACLHAAAIIAREADAEAPTGD